MQSESIIKCSLFAPKKLWSEYLKKREHLADQSIEPTATVIYDYDVQEL
jgi:hypothetical protein